MSNYFDNQDKWSWNISEKEVLVTTVHGNHAHTLDIMNVPIGEIICKTGIIEENTIESTVTEDLKMCHKGFRHSGGKPSYMINTFSLQEKIKKSKDMNSELYYHKDNERGFYDFKAKGMITISKITNINNKKHCRAHA